MLNDNKLAEDHPCVLDMIKRFFLHPPSQRDIPYSIDFFLETESDMQMMRDTDKTIDTYTSNIVYTTLLPLILNTISNKNSG